MNLIQRKDSGKSAQSIPLNTDHKAATNTYLFFLMQKAICTNEPNNPKVNIMNQWIVIGTCPTGMIGVLAEFTRGNAAYRYFRVLLQFGYSDVRLLPRKNIMTEEIKKLKKSITRGIISEDEALNKIIADSFIDQAIIMTKDEAKKLLEEKE